jgi:hypothetical protein
MHQFLWLPLSNVLCDLQGDNVSLGIVQSVNNYDLLKVAIEDGNLFVVFPIVITQTIKEFLFRNMDQAMKCTDIYFEYFGSESLQMSYITIFSVFYDGLINFYFMGKTGNARHLERGENALSKMKEWSRHSEWNFQNKFLLLNAEYSKITNNYNQAATCYEASIKAAKDHKFIHEEAMANELAALFYLEQGNCQRALSYFRQSFVCFQKWGAPVIARRIEARIEQEFGKDYLHDGPTSDDFSMLMLSDVPSNKRRQYS